MDEQENPYESILSLGKPRAKGSLSALQVKLWRTLNVNLARLNHGMETQNDLMIHQASMSICQLAHALHKILESSALEERIAVLENGVQR